MSLLRNFATVGGATMASRVLGFARDALMAGALGTGAVADAFVVAQRFPNLFRRLFAEGAFNSAFVPLFAKRLEAEGRDEARRFAEQALAGLALVLLVLTILAEIAMPWLTLVLAPGFSADPQKFELTVLLTRIAFPYLLLISLTALLTGVLNGLGRFAVAAFAPALLNVVLIGALAIIYARGLIDTPQAGIILSWGIMLGGVAQLALLALVLRRRGFGMRLVRPRYDEGMRRLLQLGAPGVVAGGITQINIVVGTIIASREAGAVAYLYYADRLYQLPLGVVGIAIGVVLLPELSRRLGQNDPGAVTHTQNRALEFAALLTLPAAVALAAVPQPIVQVLFEHGAFTPADTRATALALAAYSAGLPFFVLVKVFSPGYFAREDTATPMRYGAVAVALNVAGSVALFPFLGAVGIAVATSASSAVNAALLAYTLRRRGHLAADARVLPRLARILAAALGMGLVLLGLGGWLAPWLDRAQPFWLNALALTLLVGGGLAAYAALALGLRAVTLSDLKSLTRRKRG